MKTVIVNLPLYVYIAYCLNYFNPKSLEYGDSVLLYKCRSSCSEIGEPIIFIAAPPAVEDLGLRPTQPAWNVQS